MSSNIEVELRRQLAAKDVIIGDLTTQLTTKDAQLAAKEAVISKLKTDLVKSAAALDQANAEKLERDVEVARLVDDLDLSGCVNRVLGEVLSDLKKYEKSIIPTSCAQNCLRL
jgi:hypothetical protein